MLVEEYTTTVIQQVADLKHLVDEFSAFGMPEGHPVPYDLHEFLDEVLTLYSSSHVIWLSRVQVEIGNTGPALPEQFREKIFDPDFSTRNYETGLRLSLGRCLLTSR
jgi:nitrogen fixation/metabolism regulation signal transduction histidine kinase